MKRIIKKVEGATPIIFIAGVAAVLTGIFGKSTCFTKIGILLMLVSTAFVYVNDFVSVLTNWKKIKRKSVFFLLGTACMFMGIAIANAKAILCGIVIMLISVLLF